MAEGIPNSMNPKDIDKLIGQVVKLRPSVNFLDVSQFPYVPQIDYDWRVESNDNEGLRVVIQKDRRGITIPHQHLFGFSQGELLLTGLYSIKHDGELSFAAYDPVGKAISN